jgi:PAT family beta-lactamase induction signal transducer AmpG
LLTSLMGIPRVLASSVTGFIANFFGWTGFFMFCTLIAAPGMLLLLKFAPWSNQPGTANQKPVPIEPETNP